MYLGIVINFMMNFDYWEFNYFMSTLWNSSTTINKPKLFKYIFKLIGSVLV